MRAVPDLGGLRVGIIDNSKPNFNVLAEEMSKVLTERYAVRSVEVFRKPAASSPASESVLHDLTVGSDLVISGSGDCGSCTSYSIRDGVESRKRGVPTVVICSDAFIRLGEAQAAAFGCEDLAIAVIPHPLGTRTREELADIAEHCVQDIAKLIAGGTSATAGVADPAQQSDLLPVPADQEGFDRFCRERRWSDGLPLIPPTRERVERMLAGTSLPGDHVVALVAPGYGAATVERIAANAVMAGCAAQHLPVLITAVEAAADPAFNLQGLQATTNPTAPGILVTGPIARELGVNGGVNCLGQGAWANAVIGRAFRLVLQTVGKAFPGEMDRATQGQPAKYTLCLTESPHANPWPPMHVERGLPADQDAVTVFNIAGTLNMNTHTKNAEEMLRVFADTLIHPTSNDYWCGGEPWVILAPEHAAVLAQAGLDRLQVKHRLWELSKMPVSAFSERDRARTRRTRAGELGEIPDDASVPITPSKDGIGLLVAGGPGTHSVYAPGFGNSRSITRPLAGC